MARAEKATEPQKKTEVDPIALISADNLYLKGSV